jgi:hypothetical protein
MKNIILSISDNLKSLDLLQQIQSTNWLLQEVVFESGKVTSFKLSKKEKEV